MQTDAATNLGDYKNEHIQLIRGLHKLESLFKRLSVQIVGGIITVLESRWLTKLGDYKQS